MEQKTDEEVEIAYRVARRVANSFVSRFDMSVHRPHLTVDDLIQEGVLGWLEGKDIYYSIIDAYRKDSPITWWARQKGEQEPQTVSLESVPLEDPATRIVDVERKIDAEKVICRILEIEDEDKQFAVLSYLYFGMSFRQIGEVMSRSHEQVRKIVNPEIARLKEEFK